jgi:hypothetical protein
LNPDSVGALEITHQPAVAGWVDFGVVPRKTFVIDDKLIVGRAADSDGAVMPGALAKGMLQSNGLNNRSHVVSDKTL